MAEVNRLDYIGSNEKWSAFVNAVSNNTGKVYLKVWEENAKANRKRIKRAGWAAVKYMDAGKGKTAILLGASPAIKNQIEKLKELQADPNYIFIGISSNIRYLIQNGIVPDYVFIADAAEDITRWFAGVEEETKNMTLIASICVHPKVLDMWKGKIKYLAIYTSIEEADKNFKKMFSPLNGWHNCFFPALCSQYNTATAFAYLVLGCKILIFVGNEMGFATQEVPYYVDREDEKDKWIRKPHIDIRGGIYYTNFMLMQLKLALEDFLGKLPGFFFNATEAGIFGVNKNGNLSWIHQLTFDWAIRQSKNIMMTGNPLVLESFTKEVIPHGRLFESMPVV